jgi:membrane complex biogenesis BtpA family protein
MTGPARPIFERRPLLLGVVHLLPLPGSPRFAHDRSLVREAARRDATALLEGGMAGFVVENFGDAPFHSGAVEPVTVAEMATISAELRILAGREAVIGVNVLRNDAAGALAVASAASADFIRVNVHSGAMLTDQGWIEGGAAETLRRRRAWEASVLIAADVGVKHAIRPPGFNIVEAARETVGRGLADALICTGVATGAPVDLEEIGRIRAALPEISILAGSGATVETIATILEQADGAIVGTSLKEDGDVARPVDPDRVRAFVAAAFQRR